ncbi:MAG: YARHG domain-containing protein [Armatimonadetes bacterium]|nr:YARHG domain-containing protein [Armatimonadota bacterium]
MSRGQTAEPGSCSRASLTAPPEPTAANPEPGHQPGELSSSEPSAARPPSFDTAHRLLNASDLEGRTARELTLIRNEIFARHGRPFVDEELRRYFLSQGWYSPDPDYNDSRLSNVEKKNAALILRYQREHGLEW